MKKLFLIPALAFFAVACNKEVPQVAKSDGNMVNVTFSTGQMNTRAFFDNTSVAEPYEKVITKLDVYVVDDEGKFIVHKVFDAGEIALLEGGLSVPVRYTGRYCTFYAVANHYRNVYSTSEFLLLNSSDDDNVPYTSTFQNSSTRSREDNGFTMSDVKKVLIGSNGTVTDVSFTLKRTVAKIAIHSQLAPDFLERYHASKGWIKSVALTNCSRFTPVWHQPGITHYDTHLGDVSQAVANVDGYCCNLLYVFENFPRSTKGRTCNLEFTIVLDLDGSMTTSDDRIEYTAVTHFTGSGDGEIRRNGYYRVQALIHDVDDVKIATAVRVAEWEPPVTQVIDDLR